MLLLLCATSRGYSISALEFDTLRIKWKRNKSPWWGSRVLEQGSVTSDQAHTHCYCLAKHATNTFASASIFYLASPTAASALDRHAEWAARLLKFDRRRELYTQLLSQTKLSLISQNQSLNVGTMTVKESWNTVFLTSANHDIYHGPSLEQSCATVFTKCTACIVVMIQFLYRMYQCIFAEIREQYAELTISLGNKEHFKSATSQHVTYSVIIWNLRAYLFRVKCCTDSQLRPTIHSTICQIKTSINLLHSFHMLLLYPFYSQTLRCLP